ncbi:MAG: HDIG domain-containing protein [Puniceicoccales bacterium]|jgi:putative nucleotidyltransferase with HDIG domain|nr:HDIG domain-containing protein [Puniceicoccales bacterium]
MIFRKKFSREKIAESVLHLERHSSLNLFNLKYNLFSPENSVALTIIFILSFFIALICFWGQDLIWIQFVPNSKVKVQTIASIPFEYVSRIKTQRLKEQRRNLVAPVYRINEMVYETFEHEIFRLDELLDAFSNHRGQSMEAYLFELKSFIRSFNEKYKIDIGWSDIDILVRCVDEYGRTGILVEGLAIVKDILSEGVFDQSLSEQKNEEYFLNIEIEGASRRAHNRSENEAMRLLKLRLSSIDTTADILQAVFRILKIGIRPNIVFDNSATVKKIIRTLQNTPDVIEKVLAGDVIVEAGTTITPENYECLLAYKMALSDAHVSLLRTSNNVVKPFLVSFLVILLAYFFLCTTCRSSKIVLRDELPLMVTLLLFNLLFCRFVVWLFELKAFSEIVSFTQIEDGVKTKAFYLDPTYLLPYAMPLTFSPLLGTLLLRPYMGILVGVVTAILCCLMLSQSTEFLVISFLSILISVHCVRHAYIRTQIIRSGILGGIIFTLSAVFLPFNGYIDSRETCFLQILFGFLNGLSMGMVILLILPLFENVFKCCTNLRLIELTDYRNQLLTKLSILAPGTYHHSLMVANLAEQAATTVGANPFICRTLGLYHDVGKLVKPEYFTENQSSNKNPHDDQTPFVSALIIKGHVKDGVVIAKAAGLPPQVVDGIAEHHGTTLVRYFYNKALKQREEIQLEQKEEEGEGKKASTLDLSAIEESAFRYDGPRPQSKETLILSIADSIEAASRSLYNPTPKSIRDLVNNIITGKMRELQFDECPITFHEIDELRRSFYFTLLSMLHSRIAYDGVKA